MIVVTKVTGAFAVAGWIAFWAFMFVLTLAWRPSFDGSTIALAILPPLLAASAFWVAFRSGFKGTRLALVIELLSLAAVVAALDSVLPVFRMADGPPRPVPVTHSFEAKSDKQTLEDCHDA